MKKITAMFILLILCVSALTACGEGVGDIEPYQAITGDTGRDSDAESEDPSATEDIDAADERAEAFELYRQMMEAMADVESLDIDMNVTVDMDMTELLGMTMTIVTTGNIKQIIRSETDMDMAMELAVTVMGDTMPVTTYFTGGVLYTKLEIEGETIRYSVPMPLEKFLAESNTGMDNVLNFDENAIKDFNISRQGGNTTIEFTLDGEAVTELMDQAMAQLEVIGMDEEGASI